MLIKVLMNKFKWFKISFNRKNLAPRLQKVTVHVAVKLKTTKSLTFKMSARTR
jgi:hypothetical protein